LREADVRTLRGEVLYVGPEQVWLARGRHLLVSRDDGDMWRAAGRLSLGPTRRLAFSTRLGRRLTRAGIHHVFPEPGVAFAGRHIFRRDSDAGRDPTRTGPTFRPVAAVSGSRPLCVAADGVGIYYGEYLRNSDRGPVRVWGSRDEGRTWEPLHTFDRVRHVHGIHYDEWTGALWVTTGDEDDESAIWRTSDGFETVERVTGGSQQLRAVQLLFTADHVYFGSDTPREPNHLYRLRRADGHVERLQAVGSSVFYGCRVGTHLFFSTAAEPSDVNSTQRVEIWQGESGEVWSRIRCYTPDVWPSRLFQYGQVTFPAGPGDGRRLYFTPRGVRGGGRTVVLALDEIPTSGGKPAS
jgi:hypothetical protein